MTAIPRLFRALGQVKPWLTIWVLALGAAFSGLGPGLTAQTAAASSCKSEDYCNRSGACVGSSQVRRQARDAFGRGYEILRVRVVKNPAKNTRSCLAYAVWMRGPNGEPRTAYWDINGRRLP